MSHQNIPNLLKKTFSFPHAGIYPVDSKSQLPVALKDQA